MTEQLAQLDVRIEAEPDTDREELVAPSGTRSVGMFVAGVLTIMLARSSELLAKLIDVVQSWLSSSGTRSVRLELDGDVLEVTGIARGDQCGLIRSWIDRHTDG